MSKNDNEALEKQMSLNPNFVQQLIAAVNDADFWDDQKKAYAGNKAAGVRARNKLREIRTLAYAAQTELLVVSKNLHLTK